MIKLLIADDDPALRLLVAATLASEPYEVLEAATGLEALAVATNERPHIALLDLHMPGLNGLDVCRRIKEDPELQSVAVIMLTGAGAPADKEAGQAAGADDYLTKPFSPLDLLRTIERLAPP